MPTPEVQAKETLKTIRIDQTIKNSQSKYKSRMLTANANRMVNISSMNDMSQFASIRMTSNGWTITKDGQVISPFCSYNIERPRYKDRRVGYSQSKDVRVTNHILDGEEFVRLMNETKNRKEYLAEGLNKQRLNQIMQQNYWKRAQQTTKFL